MVIKFRYVSIMFTGKITTVHVFLNYVITRAVGEQVTANVLLRAPVSRASSTSLRAE